MYESGDNEREQRQQSETGEILRWFFFFHFINYQMFNLILKNNIAN